MGKPEDRKRLREQLLREAEDARIRARYHPTREQQEQELETARRLEQNANQETAFGFL